MSENLALMHRATCGRMGPRTALRYRRNGLYHDISWTEYRTRADRAAAGLIELGIQAGDRIALLSENRHEWLIADHAILSARAVNVPLHAPLSSEQVEYQVGHSEARGIFVSNQAQADKVFERAGDLPNLEFIVTFDPIVSSSKLRVVTWDGLQQRGYQSMSESWREIEQRENAITSDDLATIIYTSGTTGLPKGVMLTHGNLHSNARLSLEVFAADPEDVIVSWLPYSHIYARLVDHYLTTMAGITVALAASIDTLVADIKAIQPTWVTAVPRFYEKLWTSVEQLEPEVRKAALRGIFGPRLRHLSSGGAPLPRHVCQGFFDADIPLLEGYGLTESSPVISFNSLEFARIGTVGRAIPEVEVKIADDGEILTHGPHVMAGYWKNPEATSQTIVDGWLHTGDVGTLDEDGFLSITDRKKDLIITSGGKNVAPSELERLLVSDVYIDQAVVYGDGRQFISALIVPMFDLLNSHAAEKGWTWDADGDFLDAEPVVAFYHERIAKLMESVSNPERVKEFLLLNRPFQLEADELTATMKVRRSHIVAKYETQLAALYDR